MTSLFRQQVKDIWENSHDISLITKLINSDNRKYRATCWLETINIVGDGIIDQKTLITMGEDFRLAETKTATNSKYTAYAMDSILNIDNKPDEFYIKVFQYIEPDIKKQLYSAAEYGSEYLIHAIVVSHTWGNRKYIIQNTLMIALELIVSTGKLYEKVITTLLKLIDTSLNSVLTYAVSPSFYGFYWNDEKALIRDITYLIISNNPNNFSSNIIDDDIKIILDNFIVDENDVLLLIDKGLEDFSFIDDRLEIANIAQLYIMNVPLLKYKITSEDKVNAAIDYIASSQESVSEFLVPRIAELTMHY